MFVFFVFYFFFFKQKTAYDMRISDWSSDVCSSDLQVAACLRAGAAAAEELNLLIDGAEGYAIYMLDPEGRVTIWNEGAERLQGWTEAEIVGEHCSIFYPVDAMEAGKPRIDLKRARELGKFEEEDWRVRKDGSEFLAHVSSRSEEQKSEL